MFLSLGIQSVYLCISEHVRICNGFTPPSFFIIIILSCMPSLRIIIIIIKKAMDQLDSETIDRIVPPIHAREILTYDFRTDANKKKKLTEQVNMVQWNIERGMHLDRIIEHLRILTTASDGPAAGGGANRHHADSGADILVLQEVDICCRRSGYKNVCYEIAKALQMQAIFFCEFEELDAPDRAPQHSVGPLSPPDAAPMPPEIEALHRQGKLRHFHGNAIFSKCVPLRQPTVLHHRDPGAPSGGPASYMLDWEKEGATLREPRRGERGVLRVMVSPIDRQATCCTGADSAPRFMEDEDDDADHHARWQRRQLHQRSRPVLPPLFLYCCHFEVFCGPLARVRQYADILADARHLVETYAATLPAAATAHPPAFPAFVIAGDLNTMMHSIVRCSRTYARDRLTLLSLGETEACWWQRKVHGHRKAGIVRGCCPFSYRFPRYVLSNLYELLFNNALVWRWVYGLPAATYQTLFQTRPAAKPLRCDWHLCFYDPSDKYASVTLNNPAYHGCVQGKLDWVLVANCGVLPPRNATQLTQLCRAGAITDPATRRYIAQTEQSGEGEGKDRMPRDGYILFNDTYAVSDHKGIYMCIEQNNNGTLCAADYYPPYGAVYTSSWVGLSCFVLSRALPLLAVGGAVCYVLRRQRSA
ncbi:hypothetical protein STCU_06112 [Strigomonas culicis]|uniref:Endonuclease/exonuclease/phosphatase domain-containing protein n=1 Tax=Strigomonas culicis TaxID=28005 RepID=S9UCS6_9TRYP|nr:hypothetical protein STCU_06112 [Strigomonas culicis]|eukprot:EPY26723.1 hypothetical protein STCU_06112 [Strigomonas culicis]